MANAFSWEKEYKRTWEDSEIHKTRTGYEYTKVEFNDKKKGIIRHLHIIIDGSLSIDKTDYLPSFRTNFTNSLEIFISKFYSENPISALSFSLINEITIKHTEDTNFSIREFLSTKGSGHFSLLNALSGAFEILKHKDFCKEIVIITASLMLKDSDNYNEALEAIKKHGIKITIISMCGELMIFKELTRLSGGRLYVPLDLDHFNYILNSLTIPMENNAATVNMIMLGFPKVISETGVCACHYELQKEGYECPICKTYICKLPIACPICETQLVSAVNISKSYHHLYPLKEFEACGTGTCYTCNGPSATKCTECGLLYCDDCDLFVHENLHYCYGCENKNNL